MEKYLEILFPNLSEELIDIIKLIIILLISASLIIVVLGKIFPKLNLEEVKDRTKSWWVMCVVFISAVFINYHISYLFFALLSFFAFKELYTTLVGRKNYKFILFVGIAIIVLQYYLAYISWYGAYIIFIPVAVFLLSPIGRVLKGETKDFTISISLFQWILMLSVFSISHLAYLLSLPELSNFSSGGRGLLMFVIFLTEINDVMQFLWGKLLGRHKIMPKVSPNKTWEGFVGGVFSTIVLGYFLGFLTPLSPGQVIFISAFIGVAGFAGDVVVSAIKRDRNIKDMGNTIPGHGGIFDRIDSLSYTAPIFFHYVYYIAY